MKNLQINILLTDFKKDDSFELIYDRLMNYINGYQKLNIYNKKIKVPMQKIWLRIPKLKVYKSIFLSSTIKQKFAQLIVLLDTGKESIKKLIKFMEDIEMLIENKMKKIINKDIRINSCIRSNWSFLKTMKIQIPVNNQCKFSLNIYDNYNQRTDINSIQAGTYVESFIELTDIWIKDDRCGINWKVLQLKTYPEFDFSKCLFTSEKSKCNDKITSYSDREKKIINKPINIVKSNICNYMPSVKDLLSVKLKPVIKIDKDDTNVIQKNILLDIKKKLKKVDNSNSYNKLNDYMNGVIKKGKLDVIKQKRLNSNINLLGFKNNNIG